MHNLSEQQANRLMTRLHDSDVDSTKKRQTDDRWTVEVESKDIAIAMREMQKLRLTRDPVASPVEGASVVSSRDQQRFTFERALSAEIEQTLSSFQGVLEARAHLNLPQVDPLFGKIVTGARGSGSVFIVAERGMVFSREEIAKLVAGASGIQAESISVLIEALPEKTTDENVAPAELPVTAVSPHFNPETFRPLVPYIAGAALLLPGLYLLRTVLKTRSTRVTL